MLGSNPVSPGTQLLLGVAAALRLRGRIRDDGRPRPDEQHLRATCKVLGVKDRKEAAKLVSSY